MGWSGWGTAAGPALALHAYALPLLSTFSRRISVLDVAGADVSPSFPVLWACKLGDPLLPLRHTRVLWITHSHDKCFQGLILFACN